MYGRKIADLAFSPKPANTALGATKKDHEDANLLLAAVLGTTKKPIPPPDVEMETGSDTSTAASCSEDQELAACLVALSRSSASPRQLPVSRGISTPTADSEPEEERPKKLTYKKASKKRAREVDTDSQEEQQQATKRSLVSDGVKKSATKKPALPMRKASKMRSAGPPNIKTKNKNDVVCGRGASIYKLPGNVQFRRIVATRKMEYISKDDSEKMPIAEEVIAYIRTLDPPGRFIRKHTNGFWFEVADKDALKKTAMTLRQDARAIREADPKAFVSAVVKASANREKEPNDVLIAVNKLRVDSLRKMERVNESLRKMERGKTRPKASKSIAKRGNNRKLAHKNNEKANNSTTSKGLQSVNVEGKKDARASRKAGANGDEMSAQKLAKSVKIKNTRDNAMDWFDRYYHLVQYRKRVGHANPQKSKVSSSEDLEIVIWLNEQREQFRKGKLSRKKIQALRDVGYAGVRDDTHGGRRSWTAPTVDDVGVEATVKATIPFPEKLATPKSVSTTVKPNAITPLTSDTSQRKQLVDRFEEEENQDSNGTLEQAEKNSQPKQRQSRNRRDYRLLSGHRVLHKRGLPL